jgi:hypothetical protein
MEEEPENRLGTNCRNCGALLRGDYCHHCGQREGRGELYFFQALGEITGDVFTWDSRFWRTLAPLMFLPGFLTAEFIAGRRMRYLPPFRLYLIISFVLFLVVSFTAADLVDRDDPGIRITSDMEGLDPNEADRVNKALDKLDDLDIKVDLRPPAAEEFAETGDKEVAPFDFDGPDEDSGEADINIGLADEDSPPWLQELDQRIESNARRLVDEPALFLDLFLDYLPQLMFLMLPLFALLLKLVYLLSPFHYLQHLVFGLHYHSFVYLLYLVDLVIERLAPGFEPWLFLLLAVYMPLALWRAYGSGVGGAIGKSLFIYLTYGILLLFGFAGVAILTVALL